MHDADGYPTHRSRGVASAVERRGGLRPSRWLEALHDAERGAHRQYHQQHKSNTAIHR